MGLSYDIIKEYLSENKKIIILYIIVLIIAFPIEATAMSYIYGKLFKEFNNNNVYIVQKYFLAAVVVWIIVGLCRYIKARLNAQIIPSFYRFSRDYLFTKVINKYKINYSEPSLGDILTNFSQIPSSLFSLMHRMLNDHIPVFLSLIGIICYTFYINPYFGGLMFIGFIISIFVSYYKSGECVDLNFKEHSLYKESNENIQDRIGNLFNIYTSNTDEYEKLQNYIREKKIEDMSRKSIECTGQMKLFTTISSGILFAISLSIIFYLFKNKLVATSLLITATIMMTRYFSYYSSFFSGLGYTYHLIGTLKVGDKFLQNNNDQIEPDNKIINHKKNKIIIKNGEIMFKDVSFKYLNSEKHILKNSTFIIKPKKITTIFGRSGTGKTTLVKLLMGFHKLNSGKIYIDKQSIDQTIDITSLRDQISFVNQKVDLFNVSVIDNVKYGNNASTSKIQKYILENRIMPVFQNLSNGLNTICGVNGSNLSRGQRQTILLLRVMMRNTPIMIYDEPTSALDHKTKSVIMGLIKRISKSKTTLIITHDSDVLKYTDFKMRLENNSLRYF